MFSSYEIVMEFTGIIEWEYWRQIQAKTYDVQRLCWNCNFTIEIFSIITSKKWKYDIYNDIFY